MLYGVIEFSPSFADRSLEELTELWADIERFYSTLTSRLDYSVNSFSRELNFQEAYYYDYNESRKDPFGAANQLRGATEEPEEEGQFKYQMKGDNEKSLLKLKKYYGEKEQYYAKLHDNWQKIIEKLNSDEEKKFMYHGSELVKLMQARQRNLQDFIKPIAISNRGGRPLKKEDLRSFYDWDMYLLHKKHSMREQILKLSNPTADQSTQTVVWHYPYLSNLSLRVPRFV